MMAERKRRTATPPLELFSEEELEDAVSKLLMKNVNPTAEMMKYIAHHVVKPFVLPMFLEHPATMQNRELSERAANYYILREYHVMRLRRDILQSTINEATSNVFEVVLHRIRRHQEEENMPRPDGQAPAPVVNNVDHQPNAHEDVDLPDVSDVEFDEVDEPDDLPELVDM